MISSASILYDQDRLRSVNNTYKRLIGELSQYWQGYSHDSIIPSLESFSSNYIFVIEKQLSALAAAVTFFEQYKTAKQNKEISERNFQTALEFNHSEAVEKYAGELQRYTNLANRLKRLTVEQLNIIIDSKVVDYYITVSPVNTNIKTLGEFTESEGTVSSSEEKAPIEEDNLTENTAEIPVIPDKNESETEKVSTSTETNGSVGLNGYVIDTSSPIEYVNSYGLSDDEVAYLAYVAFQEQGSVAGAKVELSLMCNLYEKYKSRYSSVVDYVKNSGWFAGASLSGYYYPGDDYYNVAQEVLNNGARYLSSNVVEHDYIGDIISISTGSKNNRDDYILGETIITNVYGARYVFVGFAPNGGDPFGYLV